MNADVVLGAAAACALAAMVALGAYVAHRPLTRIDSTALTLRGHGAPLAVLFTRSGYWPALTVIAAALLAFAWISGAGTVFAIVLAGTQLLSQALVDPIKGAYRRVRPDDWLYHQERGFAFPSGHATTAVVFYGGLLAFVWTVPLPRALAVGATCVLAVWIAGIPWSRMVLAAHYATDVCGGLLFGLFWLCLMLALLRHLPGAHLFG